MCTHAAAEELSFQFYGALVNFDCPWNPMRIEQRISRVDRLGQRCNRIAIMNLRYEGMIETDVYRALRARINLFTAVVGRLQPVLSSMQHWTFATEARRPTGSKNSGSSSTDRNSCRQAAKRTAPTARMSSGFNPAFLVVSVDETIGGKSLRELLKTA